MKLDPIAKLYIQCAELEDEAIELESPLREKLAILRAGFHALLMAELHDNRLKGQGSWIPRDKPKDARTMRAISAQSLLSKY